MDVIRKLAHSALLICAFSFSIISQINPEPRLVNEIPFRLPECDFGAQLDQFIIDLQNEPSSKGKIIMYKGLNVLPAQIESQGLFSLRVMKMHFRLRGTDTKRIEIERVGYRKEQLMEFWIVPKGAEPPSAKNLLPKPEMPRDKTFLFDQREFIPPFGDELHELLTQKVRSEVYPDTELEEDEDSKYYWLSESFAKVLREDSSLAGEIIFYVDVERYDLPKVRERINQGKERILKKDGITPDRIKISFGGYREYPQIEFWIVHPSDSAPNASPHERPKEDSEADQSK